MEPNQSDQKNSSPVDYFKDLPEGKYRNAILLHYFTTWDHFIPTILGYYPQMCCSKNLAFLLMCDSSLGKTDTRLFHELLNLHREKVDAIEPFQTLFSRCETLAEIDSIDTSLIVHLYTQILKPADLITDLHQIQGHHKFHICFDDEASWELIRKLHFSTWKPPKSKDQLAGQKEDSDSFDYDHQDQNGFSIHPKKRIPEEEAKLKHQLDIELDWISQGKQAFDPKTSEGKRLLAMGWQPITN